MIKILINFNRGFSRRYISKFIIYIIISFISGLNVYSQSQFHLNLTVNRLKSDTIFIDEPVLLDISLCNPLARYNDQHNDQAKQYLDELKSQLEQGTIKQEYYDAEEKRVKATIKEVIDTTLGIVSRPWSTLLSFCFINSKGKGDTLVMQISPVKYPQTEPVAILNKTSYYSIDYGFENNLIAGEYMILARLQKVMSNKVSLTVLSEKIPPGVLNRKDKLLHYSEYYGAQNDISKAMEYAEKLILLYPNSIGGYQNRGSLYLRMEKLNEALRDYQTSLKLFYEQFPDSYEPPDYTLSMIAFIKEKLGK